MAETYVYNPGNRVIHKLVDGRGFERCNIDQIDDKREITTAELGELVAGGARLCRRDFPNADSHVSLGKPLPGQGLVEGQIITDPPMHETSHQHLRRITKGTAAPVVDHLEPRPGDGLTPRDAFIPQPEGLDAIPEELVQVDMDRGKRFEGGGFEAVTTLNSQDRGTPAATASAGDSDPFFNAGEE